MVPVVRAVQRVGSATPEPVALVARVLPVAPVVPVVWAGCLLVREATAVPVVARRAQQVTAAPVVRVGIPGCCRCGVLVVRGVRVVMVGSGPPVVRVLVGLPVVMGVRVVLGGMAVGWWVLVVLVGWVVVVGSVAVVVRVWMGRMPRWRVGLVVMAVMAVPGVRVG